ncbi:MAG: hypothetical protein ACI9WU_003510, partial [Myxococcota bacterium]
LYDADEALITRKAGIRGGQTRTITHGFAPGRYTVRIKEESGRSANGTQPYSVELAE